MPTPKTAKQTLTKAKPSSAPTKSKNASKTKAKVATTSTKKGSKTPVAKTNTRKSSNSKSLAKVAVQKEAKVTVKTKKSTKKASPTAVKATAKSAKKPVKNSTPAKTASKTTAKEAAKAVKKSAEPHALKNEITDKVRTLINLSREQGFLTFKDIDKSLPEIATDPEELQNVISIFNNLEIKLLDSAEVEKFKKNKEEKEDENARSNQSDMLDDPVRMYLKQMGQVPLLSREEEVEISKRIEVAEIAALKRIYAVSLTANFHLDICQKLIDREE
jgi:RNA polymerase primary sigma factor